MNSSAVLNAATERRSSFRIEHVEALKWVGALLMLQEHFFRYVIGELPQLSYDLGRIVFPLFAISLAFAWSRINIEFDHRIETRLLIWFAIASVSCLAVRDFGQLNVLGTLLLGLLASRSLVAKYVPAFALAIIMGWFCEFGSFGVLAVACTCLAFRTLKLRFALAAAFCFVCATWSIAPLLAGVVVLFVIGADVRVPRSKRIFYWIYALQFPAFALIAQVAS